MSKYHQTDDDGSWEAAATRLTAAEREIARHVVDLYILNKRGDIAEQHRMQSWDVNKRAGELAGAFRNAHGYTPILRVRFRDGRPAQYLLPKGWQ